MDDNTYSNPYDNHLDYRMNLMDIGPRFYMRTRHMFRFFPENPQRIIDIGCGDGTYLNLLLKKGYRADGIDGSSKAIELCKKRLHQSSGEIKCCFIDDFNPSNPYDLLICGEVLEHIEDDQIFLNHINRISDINATLIVTVPIDMCLWSDADKEAGHFRRYTKSEIFTKLKSAGFSVDQYVIWGFPLTRYLTPFIRKQQTEMITNAKTHCPQSKKKILTKLKYLLKPIKYLFLLDNIFNFTEKGVDIVIKASKVKNI